MKTEVIDVAIPKGHITGPQAANEAKHHSYFYTCPHCPAVVTITSRKADEAELRVLHTVTCERANLLRKLLDGNS